MLTLTANMLTALAARTTTASVSRNRTMLWEVYDPNYLPTDGQFNPDDAIALWAKTAITWQGNLYQRRVLASSSISQYISGQFDNQTLTIENADRYLSNFLVTNNINGMRLVARYINIDLSTALEDSVVRFVGRLQAPEGSDIDKEQGQITAKEELASLDIEVPKRRVAPEDPVGRSPNDPLFQGFLFNSRPSSVKYVETETARKLLFFSRKKEIVKYNQWSSQGGAEDQVVPLIFGRVQMAGIPVFWVDIGFYIIGIWVYSGHKITSITNFQLPDQNYIFYGPWATDLQQQEHVHLGDPGGTGTNATPDDIENTYPQNTALLSDTGYVGFAVGGPEVATQPFANPNMDDVPNLVAIIRGEIDLPGEDGVFDQVGFSDSPVYIARFVLTSPDLFGLDPELIYDGELPAVHAERQRPVIDRSNAELLFMPTHDAVSAGAGTIDMFTSSGILSPEYFKAIASAGDDPLVTPRADIFPVSYGTESAAGGGDQAITSGVPITGESVAEGVFNYYYITVPLGATELLITITGSGDGALYSRSLEKPTTTTYDGFTYTVSPLIITHTNPAAGLWWIGAQGRVGGASYDIEAVVTGGTASNAGTAQTMVRRAYTFNAPLTDTVNASDFLNDVVLSTGRLYKVYDSAGRIRIRAKKASDSSYLITDAVGGTSATGTFSLSNPPAANDTITVNGVAFTFATLPSSPLEIGIGATATATASAVAAKLNASSDPLLTVAEYESASGVVTVTHTAGAAGNSFTLAKASSVITLSGALLTGGVDGDNSILIADVEPWRASDRGYVLISPGLVTSEARAITGADYDPTTGDSITLTVNDASLTPSGGTLAGGSSSTPSSGTVTVDSVAAAGTELIVEVWDIPISYIVTAQDDVNSIAGVLAALMNADPNLRQYIRAEWDEADLVTIYSTVGVLTFDDPLLNDHAAQVDSPVAGPTAGVTGSGTLTPGLYYLGYSLVDGSGNETLMSPLTTITIESGERVSVTSLGALPAGAAEVNWYFSPAVNDDHVRFLLTNAGGSFTINVVADYDADFPPGLNTTGGETIRVAEVFNDRNIRTGSFRWSPSKSKINQVSGSFVDAVHGFKRQPITVNDLAHQRAIRQINKTEINLSAVDNFSQASRLCHAMLAEERDAGTKWSWRTDDAGIPLEIGDVVAINGNYVDLAGVQTQEWVNQPVVIEEFTLSEDFDVSFVGRVYSSALLEGQTGRRPIVVATTLKYMTEAPPVVSNVVLTINTHTLTGFVGSFDFADWAGIQRALIFIAGPSDTEPEDDDYDLLDQVLPDASNEGHFEAKAATSDKYWIKIVTQSQFGRSAETGHPVTLIDLRPSAPVDFDCLFNEVNDDALLEWYSGDLRTSLGREAYQLQIAVPADGDFSTVRDINDIDSNDWSQFVVWGFADAALVSATVAGVDPGGFDITGTGGIGTPQAAFQSKQAFLIGRGAEFEFELTADAPMPVSVGVGGVLVGRDSATVPDTATQYPVRVTDGIITSDLYTAIPGDRFSVALRPDAQIQVFLNRLGPSSEPLFTSTIVPDKSDTFVVEVVNIEGSATSGIIGGIRNATLSRFTPEWLYMAAAQLEDNSDVLPPTINARVRQLGFVEGGTPGDWTTATFTRP